MKGRRFWTEARVTGEGPFAVALDGRPVKTPMKAALDLPARALAEAVAQEWRAQIDKIDPHTMPMTRLANTAIDRVMPERARIAAEIVEFAGADLVCYRAHEPAALRALQARAWDPVLDWALARLDAAFSVHAGVVHRAQAPASLARVEALIAARDAFALTAIHNFATLTGSGLIACMLAEGALDPQAAWAAAHVDEDWQIAHWGEDEEAAARRAGRLAEFMDAWRFLELSSPQAG
jgi:chaperone required for assembly of F1-ATPase